MSYVTASEPVCTGSEGPVELVIGSRPRDLGGFSVRRVLPARERRMVGPFVFFDHMGPADFPPGEGIQVRPHPHIGLATVTYLFEGEILHRDSLGYLQPIRPGAVNLMTAGRGIVHSERAGEDLHSESRLHGIQSWMALPAELEETEPAFAHFPADDIPGIERDGAQIRVVMGSAFGVQSPVTCHSPTLYLECRLAAGATLELDPGVEETAVYLVRGTLGCGGQSLAHGQLGVIRRGSRIRLDAGEDSHLMLIGGAPLGDRHIWWNFVARSRQRIERAKSDWREGRFEPVPGDDEYIPLPD